jgi:hypothetical protein
VNQIAQKIDEELPLPLGKLRIVVKRRHDTPTSDFPEGSHIWIEYFEAEPQGRKLLQLHAPMVMALIRNRFGGKDPILFVPAANPLAGDAISQPRLERYYISCGFTWYGSGKI